MAATGVTQPYLEVGRGSRADRRSRLTLRTCAAKHIRCFHCCQVPLWVMGRPDWVARATWNPGRFRAVLKFPEKPLSQLSSCRVGGARMFVEEDTRW